MGAPQVAPALFTRMCNAGSRSANAAASAWQPASVAQSAGRLWHSPTLASSAATSSHTSALRDET